MPSLAHTFTPTSDPLWLLVEEGFSPAREHEFESLFAVANGYFGSRASLLQGAVISAPAILIAGVFDAIPPSSPPALAVFPDWTFLSETAGGTRTPFDHVTVMEHHRILDMQQGLLRRDFQAHDEGGRMGRVRVLRGASINDRHVLMTSNLFTIDNYEGAWAVENGIRLPDGEPSHAQMIVRDTSAGPIHVIDRQTCRGTRIGMAIASRFMIDTDDTATPIARLTVAPENELIEPVIEAGVTYRSDTLIVVYTSREVVQPVDAAVSHLEMLLKEGIGPIIDRHVDTWRKRWEDVDVEIDGDEEAQRALRFACYHLISAANPEDDHVSIGARGLTGSAYKGHVFWDTEIFMLPFYTLTSPQAARALLMYRYHTLPAAKDKAQKKGYSGALYAWESADTGEETAPPFAIAPNGEVIPILTGEQEHHISADIAFAVWQYWEATGDEIFLRDAGTEILIETARFWASRGQMESDGLYHIRKVIGPDEYHEGIDDNAYTNWMAQWNLEHAALAAHWMQQRWPGQWQQLAQRIQFSEEELNTWLKISARFYPGMDTVNGMIEQFAGYEQLEEIDLKQYAQRSMPIDVILGRARTRKLKVIKQADVVMLLHLLWQRIPAPVRETCFRYYEARTEHGSSLSPPIHALIAARLGDMERALHYFREAREIDLADNMGNASRGVHMAALGGLWQAVVFGFAGLTMTGHGLAFNPHCPATWSAIRFPITWHGQKLKVQVEPEAVEIRLVEGESIMVAVGDAAAIRLGNVKRARWTLVEGRWKEAINETA